jgi:outer membrane protein OmpA-like peptidoglycan-associated protein
VVAVPFDEAVRKAAEDVFAKAQLSQDRRFSLIIDPLVDGNTGLQTVATAAVEQSVIQIVKSGFPQVELKPFNGAAVASLPLIMVGTFTPINLQGKPEGDKDAYRICFALADLKTGKIISKGLARALPSGVDATPHAFFRDMPVWLRDSAVEGYIKTCQGTKAGDPIHPAYVDSVVAAATINEAKLAYEGKRYQDALALYQAVLKNPAGRQARVYAGIYLSNLRLGRKPASMKSFAQLVGMGLANEKLAVRFAFRPGATAFMADEHPYNLWLAEIAKQSLAQPGCIEVGGHAARSASDALSERLSLQRAEFVRQKVSAIQPAFAKRSSAQGYGSRQTLIGTGRGDASDALDDRIEFRKTSC